MQTGRYITQYFVYKNVFCYLCNPMPYVVQNCVGDTFVSKTGFYSLSAVLNSVKSSKTSESSDRTLIHCSGDEVYDYFQVMAHVNVVAEKRFDNNFVFIYYLYF